MRMRDQITSKCYVVEKQKVGHNIQLLRQRAGGRIIYAVLKANGYGLGCTEMAKLCSEHGLRRFAVTELCDAEKIAASGVPVDELLLLTSAFPHEIDRLVELGVTFTVASEEDAENLSGRQVRAHVKVDTGMSRRGFLAEDPSAIAAVYENYPDIQFTGIYTHFSNGGDRKGTKVQFDRFCGVLQTLEERGIAPGIRHCCSSPAILGDESMLLDGIRVGSALLGRFSDTLHMGFQRTGVCYVPVESVRQIPKGAQVGYSGLFTAKRATTTALCPLGLHNGFGQSYIMGKVRPGVDLFQTLSAIRKRIRGDGIPGGVLGGHRCKALGIIGSEIAILDVTGVPCKRGDLVEFDINPLMLNDVPVLYL